jgi:hypothetical protein
VEHPGYEETEADTAEAPGPAQPTVRLDDDTAQSTA